jgi:hypothetical protein
MRHSIAALAVILSGQNPPPPPAAPPSVAAPVADVRSYAAAMIAAPPEALKLDPFYEKYADAFGIPVVASGQVDDDAVLMARDIVNYMLAGRPDVRANLIDRGSRLLIMAAEEQQTDLPEYRNMRKPAKTDPRLTPRERENYDSPTGIGSQTDQEYWNRRARGMGGVRTSCAEENLLGFLPTPERRYRYYGEHICVHEFSHGVMSALRQVDEPLMKELEAAYANAKATGLFKGHYAENTIAEYWAEGTQWWFWSNYPWRKPDGTGDVWSPDDLKAHDPALFAILSRVYVGHRIPADIYHGRKVQRGRGSF